MSKWVENKSKAKGCGALAMELFVVPTRPTNDTILVKATLPAHLAYQKKMAEAGALVMAGPVSDKIGDSMDAVPKVAARVSDIRKWLVNKSSLTFCVSLSSQSVSMS